MKKILLLLLVVLSVPAAGYAEEQLLDRPHWSLEIKGGTFAPDLDNWAQFYGRKDMPEYAGTLAYKVLRQVELGVGMGRAEDTGKALAPIHTSLSGSAYLSGEVTTKLYPLNVFVLARGILNEDQWLVPYIGFGWTRMYYRQSVKGQGEVRGSTEGHHIRGGVQFALDELDRSAANNLFQDFGVYHTYFFVETERTTAKVKSSSVDLGGTAYLIGLLFEF